MPVDINPREADEQTQASLWLKVRERGGGGGRGLGRGLDGGVWGRPGFDKHRLSGRQGLAKHAWYACKECSFHQFCRA